MKNLLLIIFLISFVSKAQTIKSLYDDEYESINGAYYKDTHNDLDKYVGTWKYSNGSTSLTITLQKKVMLPYHDGVIDIFEDALVGEYKYIENGIEKINTLPNIVLNMSEAIDYNIFGNVIIGPGTAYCSGCGPYDRKVLLSFRDPNRYIKGYEPEMIFQRADSGGVQKLKLKFRSIGSSLVEQGVTPPYTSYTVPFGEYLLVKQP